MYRHRSKNEGLGWPHYRKCGFFVPLFYPIDKFVLIISLVLRIYAKSCNQSVIRVNILNDNNVLFTSTPIVITECAIVFYMLKVRDALIFSILQNRPNPMDSICPFFTELPYFAGSLILSSFYGTGDDMDKFFIKPFKANGQIVLFAVFV